VLHCPVLLKKSEPVSDTVQINLKTVAGVFALGTTLLGAGSTAGVALYRVSQVEDVVSTHVGLRGHATVVTEVEHHAEALASLQDRLDVIQGSVDRNQRNQIRICVAVGADCED
jgi:hypothetical protein